MTSGRLSNICKEGQGTVLCFTKSQPDCLSGLLQADKQIKETILVRQRTVLCLTS